MQKDRGCDDLKVLSFNILAPGLLLYFWRGSYGLETLDSDEDYDDVNRTRMDNIVRFVKKIDPEILCLQEVAKQTYSYLDDKTCQSYIADALEFEILSESYKESPFQYNYPPREQTRKISMDTGVATLMNTRRAEKCGIQHIETVATALEFGKSTLFRSGVGSPFTIDRLGLNEGEVLVINLHVRMTYPQIESSLLELVGRFKEVLDTEELKLAIIIGDFNASTKEAAIDLFKSPFYQFTFNKDGHDILDDHVFLGHELRKFQTEIKRFNIPLLEMNINKVVISTKFRKPEAKPPKGNKRRGGTGYETSDKNNSLIATARVSSDHRPLLVSIDLTREEINPYSLED